MNDRDGSWSQRDYLSVVELFVRTIIRFGDIIGRGDQETPKRSLFIDCDPMLRTAGPENCFQRFSLVQEQIPDRILAVLILSTTAMQFFNEISCTFFYIFFFPTKFLSRINIPTKRTSFLMVYFEAYVIYLFSFYFKSRNIYLCLSQKIL